MADDDTKNRIRAAIKRARFALEDLETNGMNTTSSERMRLVDNLLAATEDVRVSHIDTVATRKSIEESKALLTRLEADLDKPGATIDPMQLNQRYSNTLVEFHTNMVALAQAMTNGGKQHSLPGAPVPHGTHGSHHKHHG